MLATDEKQDVMGSLVELPYLCNFSVQDLARIQIMKGFLMEVVTALMA